MKMMHTDHAGIGVVTVEDDGTVTHNGQPVPDAEVIYDDNGGIQSVVVSQDIVIGEPPAGKQHPIERLEDDV